MEELRKLRQDDVIEEFLDFEWEVNENCGSGKKPTDGLLDKETKSATVNIDLEHNPCKEMERRYKVHDEQLDLKRMDYCYDIRKLRQDEDIGMEILDYEWEGDGLDVGLLEISYK